MGVSHSSSLTHILTSHNGVRKAQPWPPRGVLDCFDDIKGLLLCLFCPCVVSSTNRANIDGRPVEWIDYCCPATPYQTRQSLRQKYALDYHKPVDCIISYVCAACFINQNTREIAARAGKEPQFYSAFE